MVQRAAATVLATALLAAGSGAWAQIGELVDRSRLRVCADPDNLPFSNQAGEGFENKIAELLAESLGVEPAVHLVSGLRRLRAQHARRHPLRPGDRRRQHQRADAEHQPVLPLELRADPARRRRTEGRLAARRRPRGSADRGVARTPPATVLARARACSTMLVPYQLMVDTRFEHPAQQIVADVAAGRIEVGVLWGPIAGYWASRQEQALAVVPLSSEAKGERLDFRITMGLRRNEPQLGGAPERLPRREAGGDREDPARLRRAAAGRARSADLA